MMDGKLRLNANKLKSLRKKKSISQETMANQCFSSGQQISLATLKRAELGRPILYRTAKCLASFFSVELNDILEDIPNSNSHYKSNGNIHNLNKKPLIGRQYETQQLEQALEIIRNKNSGRLVYIRGVAGIGKTHLVTYFLNNINSEEFQTITIKLNSKKGKNGNDSLKPLLLNLIDLPRELDCEKESDKIKKNLEKYDLNNNEIFHYFTLIGVTAPKETCNDKGSSTYYSISENENNLLIKLIDTSKKRVVLTVEDIHWASNKLLLILRHLSSKLSNLPLLLVLTSRLENDPLDSIWRSGVLNTPLTTLDISPLNPEDAKQITLEHEIDDSAYVQQCVTLSEGNPLFLLQLLVNYPQRLGAIPASVSELTLTRLKLLSPANQEAICAAALIGDEFSIETLYYLIKQDSVDTLELTYHYFIYPSDEGKYTFSHSLIRQGVLESIDDPIKAIWHRRLTEWYKYKNHSDYAYHLSKTKGKASSGKMIDAAKEFIEKYNYADALDLVNKAIKQDDDISHKYQLYLTKGEILQRLDLAEKSIMIFQQAIELSHTEEQASHAQIALASAYISAGRFKEANYIVNLIESEFLHYLSKEDKNKINHIKTSIGNKKKGMTNEQPDTAEILQSLTEIKQHSNPCNNVDKLSPLPKQKVGVLHSLTGFMKELEEGVLRSTLLAISEINNQGGLLGHQIEPIIEDSHSSDEGFEKAAHKLLETSEIATIFGCSTSSSRKRVKPLIEKEKQLLVYPFQYEGIESSNHIAYVGPAPNQQALPAAEWLVEQGNTTFMLLGSDYIYPRVTNKLIKEILNSANTSVEAELYVPLGHCEFEDIIHTIKTTPCDAIIITLVGLEANQRFFEALSQSGISPKAQTILSLVLSENDLCEIPSKQVEGVYSVFSYFQNIESPLNEDFVRKYKHTFGAHSRIGGYMESAYTGVHLWANAVQRAEEFTPGKIMEAMKGSSLYAPGGIAYFDEENNHVWRNIRLARVGSDGEYHILWESENPIRPDPYPLKEKNIDWDDYIQGEKRQLGGKWENIQIDNKPAP